MPWDSGQGGSWGGKPPEIDIDALIRKAIENFRKKMGGKLQKFVSGAVIIIAVTLWLLTGIYIVHPGEVGVVKRFGKAVYSTGPGPHWHLPFPIESAMKVTVERVRRVEIGFKTVRLVPTAEYRKIPRESLMLTGDKNIVAVEFIVQYKVKDAIDYLFNVKNPDDTVKDAAESAMREVVGRENIDSVLTVGKFKIQQETKALLQEILDKYRSGIAVVAVQLQDVTPPQEVIHAFKDVQSAREDREKAINEAEGYRNDILPKAKGEAANIINKAIAYKEMKIKKAQGEVSRYLQTLAEYKKAKEITRKRLYIETMEEILQDADKLIVDSEVSRNIIPHLPLIDLRGRSDIEGKKR